MSYQLVLKQSDREFYDTIREATLPPDEFNYMTAVRAAWTVIANAPSLDDGAEGVVKLLRYYKYKTNTYHTYNDTWTKFYVWCVTWGVAEWGKDVEWPQFWAFYEGHFPADIWMEYYSAKRWNGPAARAVWTEPDRRRLPRIKGVEL